MEAPASCLHWGSPGRSVAGSGENLEGFRALKSPNLWLCGVLWAAVLCLGSGPAPEPVLLAETRSPADRSARHTRL